MASRIYIVSEKDGTETLARAVSQGRALGVVVQDRYSVRIASAEDVARVLTTGGTIITDTDTEEESSGTPETSPETSEGADHPVADAHVAPVQKPSLKPAIKPKPAPIKK